MGVCETCGNHYKNTFKVILKNVTHDFDCFECAIHRLAPVCASCSCRVIGQGVEEEGIIYCGNHCARMAGRSLIMEDTTGI
ncbi:hypothetical protein [Bdellovibrio bacteriovorus]|uniref:hypothetical protein n=1 Tax=Bdellovibrio TaxID=958 RepID=UPI0035A82565